MRSLFGTSAVMLMFFNYIEISSGMNQGRDEGKTLNLFGETPESLGRKSETKSALSMVDGASLRLYNGDTTKFVDRERTGVHIGHQIKGQLNPLHQKALTIQTDWNDIPKAFDHNAGVFDGDEPYVHGTREYKRAYEIQKAYYGSAESKLKAPVPEDAWNVQTEKWGRKRACSTETGCFVHKELNKQDRAHYNRQESEDSNTSLGSNALAGHYSYKQNNGLLPKISQAGVKQILKQLKRKPYVDAPHPGQGSAAGHDPYRLNQGHHGVYAETPRVPRNAQFSGQFASHYYYQGPPGSSKPYQQ